MTDLSNLTAELAAQRIAGQIADRQGTVSRTARRRRALPRQATARRLRRLADRLDT